MYKDTINNLLLEFSAPEELTANMVECYMRLEYQTLSHLSIDVFRRETKQCVCAAVSDPEFIEEMKECIKSYGM